jgi:hypothetical protein
VAVAYRLCSRSCSTCADGSGRSIPPRSTNRSARRAATTSAPCRTDARSAGRRLRRGRIAPVRRRLLHLLYAFSLLLSVAVVALWVRSSWVQDSVEYRTASPSQRRYRVYEISSVSGVVEVLCGTTIVEHPEALDLFVHDAGLGLKYSRSHPDRDDAEDVGGPSVWDRLGFKKETDHETSTVTRFRRNPRSAEDLGRRTTDQLLVVFPYWLPWLIFLAGGWPLIGRFARRATARIARPSNRCRQCGYDLRATPDRCPECGAVAAPTGLGQRLL